MPAFAAGAADRVGALMLRTDVLAGSRFDQTARRPSRGAYRRKLLAARCESVVEMRVGRRSVVQLHLSVMILNSIGRVGTVYVEADQ